jgi:hypothetical protein
MLSSLHYTCYCCNWVRTPLNTTTATAAATTTTTARSTDRVKFQHFHGPSKRHFFLLETFYFWKSQKGQERKQSPFPSRRYFHTQRHKREIELDTAIDPINAIREIAWFSPSKVTKIVGSVAVLYKSLPGLAWQFFECF